VQRRQQEQDSHRDDSNALKNAQRTRVELEDVLRVERIPHETGTGKKSQRIADSSRGHTH
jgi:hypothetical protein